MKRFGFLTIMALFILGLQTGCVTDESENEFVSEISGVPGDVSSDNTANGIPSGVESSRAPQSGYPIAPLPAWQTQEEIDAVKDRVTPYNSVSSRPPTGNVYVPAEYASMSGVIVSIPLDMSYSLDYFGKLVKGITDAGATAYIMEPDQNSANYAYNNVLRPYGVSRDDVEFFYMGNDAFWSRDYGPWHVYVDGERVIVDHNYYPYRVNDDAVPSNFGDTWDEDVYHTNFNTEGGNFMTDGLGTCWASTGIFDMNRITVANAKRIYETYLGCSSVHFIEALYQEGTTHIDMFSKILNQDTIMVAYSNYDLGANYEEILSLENAAEAYANTPKPGGGDWNIVRIPMTFGYEGGYRVYFSHTNSLIINDSALVPTYGRGSDSAALQVYRQAMPGYRVVGIDSNSTIPSGGAIHCTTMQVPLASYQSCGDGVITGSEQCDFYLNGRTCTDLGYAGGTLGCSACQYDASGCYGSGGSTTNTTGNNGSGAGNTGLVTARESGTVVKDDYEIYQFDSADGIKVVMTGSGDVDLYVWNRSSGLTWTNYDCRPYLEGSSEECDLSGDGVFYVVVAGYASSSDFQIAVTYSPLS